MTRNLCIYHGNCTDGFTAAWAVWKARGDLYEYLPCKYGDPTPDVTGCNVLMVDFSFKAAELRAMAAVASSIIILDHHKTAEADLEPLFAEGLIGGIFDMERSGAGIAWDYFHGSASRPKLVNYVEDRDLWRWKLDFSREISSFVSSIPMADFQTWSKLADTLEDRVEFAHSVSAGRALDRKMRLDVEHLRRGARWMHVGGHIAPVVNANGVFASDLGNSLARIPEAPFGATYFINKDGHSVFSLRSTDEKIDVSAIASQYGGGGHRNASGFLLPEGAAL